MARIGRDIILERKEVFSLHLSMAWGGGGNRIRTGE
jgi:hypothetical protein